MVARSPQVHLRPDLLAPWQARGAQIASFAMKTPLWIALTLVVVLGAGSGLAVLNSGVQDRSSHLVRAGVQHSTSRKGWNVDRQRRCPGGMRMSLLSVLVLLVALAR